MREGPHTKHGTGGSHEDNRRPGCTANYGWFQRYSDLTAPQVVPCVGEAMRQNAPLAVGFCQQIHELSPAAVVVTCGGGAGWAY